MSKEQRNRARSELTASRQHLAQVSAGSAEETDEYLAANRRVIDAEESAKAAGVPWWRR